MKFNQFTLRQLLANTDYLVGYDSNTGSYIRIAKDDLIETLAYPEMDPMNVSIQYKGEGLLSNWHSTMSAGDRYVRIKIADYQWSEAVDIQSLSPQFQLTDERLVKYRNIYTIKDEGHRKVFSVSIKEDTEIVVSLHSLEAMKILVTNDYQSGVDVKLSSEDDLNIIGLTTINLQTNSSLWIELQKVEVYDGYVIVAKNTAL